MGAYASRSKNIVDGHVHVGPIGDEQALLDICEATGISRMVLVAIQDAESGSGLPEALYMKARHPEKFYVFAGLNHGARLSAGKVSTPSLARQVDSFVEMGCDGIKMIEGKPTWRQILNIPVTDPYFEAYWARVEEVDLPLVWHVNDPEEFWDPQLTPEWARSRGWGYGPEDVRKEDLYAEVAEVLRRHPGLRVIFAHFYFLSADLPRASRFLDEHPRVNLDLTPGIEMLYNTSRDPEAADPEGRPAGREFFVKYADRIVFGTDIWSGMGTAAAAERAGIIYRWLESGDTFTVGEDADFLLGPPEDGVIRGMSLPENVLAKIYWGNMTRVAAADPQGRPGANPKALDVAACVAQCESIAAIAEAMSGPAETQAAKVARALREM
jgi:predicted TIM-barrel fold metal-dependent hydrolase